MVSVGTKVKSSRLRVFYATFSVMVSGCSLSGVVQRNSVDYNRAVEDVTNQLIVTNILRARDHVPLHFTDLSLIHGSLQVLATGNAALPVGEIGHSTTRPRDLLTLGATVSSSPAFDTSPLNSSGFTEGLLSPVPFKYFRWYLDRGVSQSLLLNLLIEKISLTRLGPPPVICDYHSTSIAPNPVELPKDVTPPCPPPGYENVKSFQDLIGSWTKPVLINDYDQVSPFGPPLAVNPQTAIRDLATAGSGTLMLRQRPDGRYQFYKSKSRTAVCIPAGPGYVASAVSGEANATAGNRELSDACYRHEVERADDSGTTATPDGKRPQTQGDQLQVTMYMRSVKGVIEYLGELARLPVNVKPPIAFYVRPGLQFGARVSVDYDGQSYHVDEYREGSDETVQVLSIVNDLLDLIKKANEIPNTPSVQVLQ